MTDNTTRRRGPGEDAIYFDAAKNRFAGAISVGFGPDGKRLRRKVTGRTKAEIRDKLKAAHRLAAGSLWQDHGLVFASAVGTPLDAANVRREFRQITEAAGLRRSPAWPATTAPPRQSSSTVTSCVLSSSQALK